MDKTELECLNRTSKGTTKPSGIEPQKEPTEPTLQEKIAEICDNDDPFCDDKVFEDCVERRPCIKCKSSRIRSLIRQYIEGIPVKGLGNEYPCRRALGMKRRILDSLGDKAEQTTHKG